MEVSKERGVADRLAEFSKKTDVVVIVAGGVVYVFNPAVGAFLIVGSVITLVGASALQKLFRKKKS